MPQNHVKGAWRGLCQTYAKLSSQILNRKSRTESNLGVLEVESNFTTFMLSFLLSESVCLSVSLLVLQMVNENGGLGSVEVRYSVESSALNLPNLQRGLCTFCLRLVGARQKAYGYGGLLRNRVGGKNPKQPPGMYKNPVRNGIKYQPRLEDFWTINHQQYVCYSWRDLPSEKWWCLRWVLPRGWLSFFESDILKQTWSSLDLLSLDSPNQCMVFDVRASPTSIANGRPTDYLDLLSYAGSESHQQSLKIDSVSLLNRPIFHPIFPA